MAADWGDDGPPLSRALVQRVFCYFVPYWRRALTVLACIGVAAGLGLVPALVTKGVIDYLGDPTVTQDISGMGRVKRRDSAQAFIHERA